jgi:hypothetical protein
MLPKTRKGKVGTLQDTGTVFRWMSYRVNPQQVSSTDIHCSICGKPEAASTKRLASDHDHDNGRDRGFLCHNCNTGLGLFRDDPSLLKKAVGYLYHWREKHGKKAKPSNRPTVRQLAKNRLLHKFLLGKVSLPDALVQSQLLKFSR